MDQLAEEHRVATYDLIAAALIYVCVGMFALWQSDTAALIAGSETCLLEKRLGGRLG